MSNLNNREVDKKPEKLQEEMLNSNSILDFDSEEEQESIEQIKKRWRKKQIKKFNQLQHKQSEKKQIKKLVSGLTFGAILLVIIPFIPTVTSFILGSSSGNNTANTNENSESIEVGEKTELNRGTEGKNDLVETWQELDTQPDSQKMQNSPVTNQKGLGKLFKNLKTIKEKQKEHNSQLQKVIDMSDGKQVSPETE